MAKNNRAFDHSKYPLWIDPNEVTPYEKNVKIHDEKQIKNIVNSIKRFGWQQDTVITSDKVLVIGHGRRLAALKIGCEMPYHMIDKTADELTDEDIRELRIADNQTNAETGFDLDLLNIEIGDLEFDGFDFDFSSEDDPEGDGADWFNRSERFDTSRQEGNDEYNEFLDKFEQPKTTDDCYTPDNIYGAICDWVQEKYGANRQNFVRPFYPNGDYQGMKYKQSDIVVDNPPFSILAEIVDFYTEKGIRFFLFAPALSCLNYTTRKNVCCLGTMVSVTYENGATVNTSFLTNLDSPDVVARNCPDLYEKIEKINKENEAAMHRNLPKYDFPYEVLTSARFGYLAKYGQEMNIPRDESMMIRQLDAMKEVDKGIYGNALLLSERLTAERAAAERAAAERAAATVWKLSDREREIVKSLGRENTEEAVADV